MFACAPLIQERISEALRLSPAVAGVTLLSFGNGAPDVFTQMSMASGVSGEGKTAAHPEGNRPKYNMKCH